MIGRPGGLGGRQRLFVGLEVLLKTDMIRKGKERKQRKPRK